MSRGATVRKPGMGFRTLTLAALLVSLLAPQLALAKAVQELSFAADAADLVVTLRSDEALAAPAVRTGAGTVRLRFYDVKNVAGLRVLGDGQAVRSIELGRGSDQSAALLIVLGDKTRLAASDIRVERGADKVVLKIARGLLPALGELPAGGVQAKAPPALQPAAPATTAPAAPVMAAPSPKPAPAAPAKAAPVTPAPTPAAKLAPPPAAPAPKLTPPVAAPEPTPAATAAKAPAAPASPEPAAPAASPAATPAVEKPALGTKKANAEQKPLKLAPSDSSPMPMLLTISALLALAYAALRVFMRKQATAAHIPSIDVIAQKRLGPRHQLVIVRAFDRDYLLSIQGTQTTVVARSSRRKVEASEELLAPQRTPAPPLPKTAFEEEDDEVTFGGELFKQALEQRERAREQTASFRLEAARAEARAELARLDSSRAAKSDNDNDEQPAAAPAPVEPSPDAISESVSGLLRLRREAGR